MTTHREHDTLGWGAVAIVAAFLLGALIVNTIDATATHEPTVPTVTMTTEASPSPTYDVETRFATVVTQNGVADRDVNRARGVAQSMCVYLTAGDTIEQAKSAALVDWTYGPRPTAAVIGAAAFFCPQHADVLNEAARLGVES